jgi:outer membrane protein OmpA-like peptidoglycan-associated protein
VATAVWFAPDVEVLGLQGSQRALSVLEEAKRASRVYLRGHASPLDVTRADHDQLAIGRAYSLRKFFESHGIAPERITILHRNPEVQSRHVEVMLRG